jgi:hypothetical protein
MDNSSDTRPEDALEPAPIAHPLSVGGRRRGVATGTGTMRGRRAVPQPAADAPAVTEGIPEQLADMRWVYSYAAREDRTQGHKICRKWLNTDPHGFMTRKTSLEAKVAVPRPHDVEYPVRLQLDGRRADPALNHGEMISLLVFIEGTDDAFELYLTVEEWTAWRDAARDAGLSLPDWMLGHLRVMAVETLAGPPGPEGLRLLLSE